MAVLDSNQLISDVKRICIPPQNIISSDGDGQLMISFTSYQLIERYDGSFSPQME